MLNGVEGSLSEEDGLLLRGNTELIVEGVVPDLLHIIPVGDDSMLNGVLEGKDTSLGLGLISNIGILLSHTDHHPLVAGTANNGGEDSSGSVISSETSFAHAGAIVNNKSSNVLVTHLDYWVSVLGDENLSSLSCGLKHLSLRKVPLRV